MGICRLLHRGKPRLALRRLQIKEHGLEAGHSRRLLGCRATCRHLQCVLLQLVDQLHWVDRVELLVSYWLLLLVLEKGGGVLLKLRLLVVFEKVCGVLLLLIVPELE